MLWQESCWALYSLGNSRYFLKGKQIQKRNDWSWLALPQCLSEWDEAMKSQNRSWSMVWMSYRLWLFKVDQGFVTSLFQMLVMKFIEWYNVWEQWKTQGQRSLLQFYIFSLYQRQPQKELQIGQVWAQFSLPSALVLVNLSPHSPGCWCFCLYLPFKFDNWYSFSSMNHCSQLWRTEIWMCLWLYPISVTF